MKQRELAAINALRDAEDLLERVLCPFVLLDETAKCAVDGAMSPPEDGITVGIKASQLTREVLSTIKALRPNAEITPTRISYLFEDVPVVIKIIKRTKYLKSPDQIGFCWDFYKVPNPFEEYWRTRGLLR